MPKRDVLLGQLAGENDYGILLTAQVGGVPDELQLIVGSATYDRDAGGLRERAHFIIRALGVREHQLHLGLFGRLAFSDDHPVLYHHNTPRTSIVFEGTPAHVHELALDIYQAYASTFGPWRDIADDLNRAAPLVDLLQSGRGILGEMPRPAAERMAQVFAHHGMAAQLHAGANFTTEDEHGRSKLMKLLAIDNAYVIALDFSVEELGKA